MHKRFLILTSIVATTLLKSDGQSLTALTHAKIIEIDGGIKNTNQIISASIERQKQRQSKTDDQVVMAQLSKDSSVNETLDESDLEIPLTDKHDYEIYARLYFGSHQQPLDMIMDTGSGATWMWSRLCDNCGTNTTVKYDERESKTFSFYPAMYDFHYGIGNTYGYNSFDKACLKRDESCTDNDFSHFLIGNQKQLDGVTISGLVGLSPVSSEYDRQDLLVDKLLKSGVIDERVFSFSVNLYDNRTSMTFGGYDLEKYAQKGFPLQWQEIMQNKSTWWTLPLDNCTFERQNGLVPDSYSVVATKNTTTIIVDSGTSYVLMGIKDRTKFLEHLYQDRGIYCHDDFIPQCYCDGTQEFPSFKFMIQGQAVFLPNTSYVYQDNDSKQCHLKLMASGGDQWIFGLNFFDNYYVIFDQEKQRVGFQLKANSTERMKQLHTNESAFVFNTTQKVEHQEADGVAEDGTILSESQTNFVGQTQAFVIEQENMDDESKVVICLLSIFIILLVIIYKLFICPATKSPNRQFRDHVIPHHDERPYYAQTYESQKREKQIQMNEKLIRQKKKMNGKKK